VKLAEDETSGLPFGPLADVKPPFCARLPRGDEGVASGPCAPDWRVCHDACCGRVADHADGVFGTAPAEDAEADGPGRRRG